MFGTECNPWFDRSILLTDATTGLGPALARALVARGARPVAIAKDPRALAALAAEVGGMATLACDAGAPEHALGIARWLAEDNAGLRGLGGAICNAAAGPGLTAAAAPLLILGLLGQLGGGRQDALVALILPEAPAVRGLRRLAGRLRDLRWHAGGSPTLTAVTLGPGLAAAGPDLHARAAGRILDAVAAGRPLLRIAPGGDAAHGWRGRAAPGLQRG